MAALLFYDTIKFILAHDLMLRSGINPWLFFFLDVVTIPGYIMGWGVLISGMGKNIAPFLHMIKWGIITFFCTTAPYGYALWAGKNTSSLPVMPALAVIILILTFNMLRKICRTAMQKP